MVRGRDGQGQGQSYQFRWPTGSVAGRGEGVLEAGVGGGGDRATEQSWPSSSNRVVRA